MTFKVEDSVMHITYKNGVTIDLEAARQIIKERLSFFEGKSYPVLLNGRGVKLMTKEARDFLAKGDAMKGVIALAILPGSYLTIIMANLFIKFSKPTVPTKVFKTRENATAWLQEFIDRRIDA